MLKGMQDTWSHNILEQCLYSIATFHWQKWSHKKVKVKKPVVLDFIPDLINESTLKIRFSMLPKIKLW